MLHGAGRFIYYKFTSNIWAKIVGKYKPYHGASGFGTNSSYYLHWLVADSRCSRPPMYWPHICSLVCFNYNQYRQQQARMGKACARCPVLSACWDAGDADAQLAASFNSRTLQSSEKWLGQVRPLGRAMKMNSGQHCARDGWTRGSSSILNLARGKRPCIFWRNKWHTATLGLASTCANHGCLHGKRLNMWWITGIWRSLMGWIPNVGNWADRS
jgi:hypothetical protein